MEQDRHQHVLFPESLDDYIDAAHPVHFLAVFVHGLDLKALGFTHSTPNQIGRPSYHPGDRLQLYRYGCFNTIRSRRQREHDSQRNLELMWLLHKLTPDFKTIADCRQANPHALQGVCRACTVLCKTLDLFGRELIAIDGSTCKAVKSQSRHVTEKKLQNLLQHINERINTSLKELDEQDTIEAHTKNPITQVVQEKIDQ